MKSTKEIISYLNESFSKKSENTTKSDIEKGSNITDAFDYKRLLMELLIFLREKRHWQFPEINFLNELELERRDDLKKIKVKGLGLDTYYRGLNFLTPCWYIEEDRVNYNPKEIFNTINWYDIEWKHNLTKEIFFQEIVK